MTHIQFKKETLTVSKRFYNTGAIALTITDEQGFPYMTATVNLPNHPLDKNQTFIKNWSENEGILESLITHNIVKDTGKTVITGYVEANLVEVLI